MTEEKIESADVVCPIMCGHCCSYWRDVDELVAKNPTSIWRPCPNLNEDMGCTLPRNERPSACLEYICEKADMVVHPNEHTLMALRDIINKMVQK